MTNLFTEHDKYHIHKVLGFGCLSHFVYRFYNKLTYGIMFVDNSPYTYISPLIHLSLSLSSFLFHVPTYRFQSKAIIWRELQLHNIIFTSRSVFMIYHAMYFKDLNALYYYTRLGIILIHHYLADLVSDKYKYEDKTTTRDIPIDTDNENISYFVKKYYAISQLIATGNLLLSNKVENGFMIIFPIQLSTFLMTLVRKNKINNNTWHIFYALSLAVPYILNYRNINLQNNQFFPIIFYAYSRIVLETDKYINMIWLTVLYSSWCA